MARQKTATILEPQTNRVSTNQRFLYSPLESISRNDLFLEKHNIRTTANATTNSTCIYKLSEVKFLGDTKRPTKGFYLEVWKIDSAVFLYQI